MSDLILKDVSFSYPGGFLAVDHINMEIKSGENVAIVGQNGAGKTTTVKMMKWTSKTNRRGRSNWRYEYKRLYNCTSIKGSWIRIPKSR